MTTRSRRSSRPRSRRRQKTTWENVNFEVSNGAGGATTLAELTPVLSISQGYQVPSKIIRSIIRLTLTQDVISAEPQTMAVGIFVVNHEAIDSGGSTPDVIADFQQDFYYWTTMYSLSIATILPVFEQADIRTSRILRGGYGLLFKAQTPVQESATKLQVSMRNLWVLGA